MARVTRAAVTLSIFHYMSQHNILSALMLFRLLFSPARFRYAITCCHAAERAMLLLLLPVNNTSELLCCRLLSTYATAR